MTSPEEEFSSVEDALDNRVCQARTLDGNSKSGHILRQAVCDGVLLPIWGTGGTGRSATYSINFATTCLACLALKDTWPIRR